MFRPKNDANLELSLEELEKLETQERIDLGYTLGRQGNELAKKLKYRQAITRYTQALRVLPSTSSLISIFHSHRGNAWHALGAFENAIADFSAALKHFPDEATTYIRRGNANKAQGNLAQAIDDFTQALQAAKNHVDSMKNNPHYNQRVKAKEKNAAINRSVRNFLSNENKKDIFNAIKTLPLDKQIPLLQECLKQDTVLGGRFWKAEGQTKCSLESGTLKEINNYLKMLPEKKSPSETSSVLFKKVDIKEYLKEENKTFDHSVFKL